MCFSYLIYIVVNYNTVKQGVQVIQKIYNLKYNKNVFTNIYKNFLMIKIAHSYQKTLGELTSSGELVEQKGVKPTISLKKMETSSK